MATLKAKGIERPVIPDFEPEPIVDTKTEDKKLDQMALNCKELKQNLAELQGQLSSITVANKNTEKKNKKKKIASESSPKSNPESVELLDSMIQEPNKGTGDSNEKHPTEKISIQPNVKDDISCPNQVKEVKQTQTDKL